MKWLVPLLVLSCACPPKPVTPPLPDAAPAPQMTVCEKLAYLGCPEGVDPDCAVVVQRIQDYHLTPFDASCVLEADSPEAVRKCPAVTCD